MIRVALFSDEEIPDSFTTLLVESDQIALISDFSLSDVIVVYAETWNRASMERVLGLPVRNAPIVVICKRANETFANDSVRWKQIVAVLPIHATIEQIVLVLRSAIAGFKTLHPYWNGKGHLPEIVLLTPRELEILRLIADGEGNKSIAYLLQISEHTVKFHISSIFEKLHVSSRTEAVKAGITRGLISI